MQINGEQRKILEWVEAKERVVGMFHVMTAIKPMIEDGLIERTPLPGSRTKLVITEQGKEALTRH